MATKPLIQACEEAIQKEHRLLHVCEVEALRSPYERCGYLCDSYTKLQMWRLPVAEVVFLDADVLLLAPLEDLFGQAPEGGIAASEDCCSGTFNTGVVALRPSVATFGIMMKRWRRLRWAHTPLREDDFAATMGKEELRRSLGHSDHSDQGFLWGVFQGSWHRLPVTDNFLKDCRSLRLTSWLDALPVASHEAVYSAQLPERCNALIAEHAKKLRAVHFIGAKKPWMCPSPDEDCEEVQGHRIPVLWELWWKYSADIGSVAAPDQDL